MIKSARRFFAVILAFLFFMMFDPAASLAANNCVFARVGPFMYLQASCSTDETILIPQNATLDGKGFKITAIDPPSGYFKGAVLANTGSVANVKNLFVRAKVADVCRTEEEQLVGVRYLNGGGTLANVNITMNTAEGTGTCPEGTAILATKLPYSSTATFAKVSVKGGTFNYNQLAAFRARGNVALVVEGALIKAEVNTSVAQRGIDVSEGVKSTIKNNQILRFSHAPALDNPAYGILMRAAGPSTVAGNVLANNDIAVRVNGGTKIVVTKNTVRNSLLDGIQVDDGNGLPTAGITLSFNDSQENNLSGISLINLSGLLTKNAIRSNLTTKNLQTGIVIAGSLNAVQQNNSTLNSGTGIIDTGTGNKYLNNKCDTSSGPPVDCPRGTGTGTGLPPVTIGTCTFLPGRGTWVLQGSCATTQTIVVPDKTTIVGGGFSITAMDPAGGYFQGPILTNGGKTAGFADLFVKTELADNCNDPAGQLIGIHLKGAAGSLSNVTVRVDKAAGASSCQEGIGLLAEQSGLIPVKVTVKNSAFNYNQLGAIRAVGAVALRVESSLIRAATNPNIPQRGIELRNGAKGYILKNEVIRFSHAPSFDTPGYGIFLENAGQSTIQQNTLNYNDVAVRVTGSSKIAVNSNVIRSSNLDGILVDDGGGVLTTQITVLANDVQKSTLNGINLQSVNGLLRKNIVKANIVSRNLGMGIVVEGSEHKVQSNNATLNTNLDIADFGTANYYSFNTCTTSSGPPVDCPAPAGP